MICWFEDRAQGTRLSLEGLVERISITRAQDVESGLARIEQAQAAGHWVAVVIDYEFGLWLEPSLRENTDGYSDEAHRHDDTPRLTALVYASAHHGAIEDPPETARTDTNRSDESAGHITAARAAISRQDYLDMVQEIRSLIAAGEVYQINATFPIELQIRGSTRDLYCRLAQSSQAKYCAYIEDPHSSRSILSLSPELFVYRERDRLITRPMKGTAPRIPAEPAADRAMGESLRNSIKDRAENLMIVDLLRNDLGRLAVTGTVQVDPLFELEAYPSVWTLTSTIHAQLKPDCSLFDILQALFPCGSITGAPKIAAMRHIKRLERRDRDVYCGSVGWLAPDGRMSLNVAIRTLVIGQDGRGVYGVGGGIVYDSVPENEWQECFWKARILGVNCET